MKSLKINTEQRNRAHKKEINPGLNERIYASLTKPILEDDYEKTVKNINYISRYRGILMKLTDTFSRFRG